MRLRSSLTATAFEPGQFADARIGDKPLSEVAAADFSKQRERERVDWTGKRNVRARAHKLEFKRNACVQARDKAAINASGGGAKSFPAPRRDKERRTNVISASVAANVF